MQVTDGKARRPALKALKKGQTTGRVSAPRAARAGGLGEALAQTNQVVEAPSGSNFLHSGIHVAIAVGRLQAAPGQHKSFAIVLIQVGK